jgi:hypothetical protein
LEGGPPKFSQGSTSPDLLDRSRSPDTYGTVTLCGRPFQTIRLSSRQRMARSHGLVRFRSPLLTESRLISFPPGTEMFQFPGFASRTYGFSAGYRIRGGLPHSDIHGSKPARGSPWLFAACHVLHRLLVPRHPPNALLMLEITGTPMRERIRIPTPCTGTILRPHRSPTGSAKKRPDMQPSLSTQHRL